MHCAPPVACYEYNPPKYDPPIRRIAAKKAAEAAAS